MCRKLTRTCFQRQDCLKQHYRNRMDHSTGKKHAEIHIFVPGANLPTWNKTMMLKSDSLAFTSIQHEKSIRNKILVSQRLSFGHIYPTSQKKNILSPTPLQNNPNVESAPNLLFCTLTLPHLFKSISHMAKVQKIKPMVLNLGH